MKTILKLEQALLDTHIMELDNAGQILNLPYYLNEHPATVLDHTDLEVGDYPTIEYLGQIEESPFKIIEVKKEPYINLHTSVDDLKTSFTCSWKSYTEEDFMDAYLTESRGGKRASVLKLLERGIIGKQNDKSTF